MNAGEAVFQGREGTGLAQILNWKDYRPQQRQNVNPLQIERFMQQKRAADDKKIEEFTKFDKGYAWFNPTHDSQRADLEKSIRTDLDNNPTVSPERIASKYKDVKDQISFNIQKGLSAAETYKRKKSELTATDNIDMNRATSFLNDTLFPTKDERGQVDFEQIDENTAMQVDLHPSVYDAQKAVFGTANKIKSQIELGEVDPEMFRGNNGAYFEKKFDKWRFRVDKNGKIASDVIDNFANDPKIYDRILWDQLAEKNGVLADSRITSAEREQIDELFTSERINPKNAPEVKAKIESWLNQIQGEVHRTDNVSAGRDINPGAGYGNPVQASVIEGDKRQYRKYDQAKTDEVSSYGQFSIPYNSNALSNLEGVYPGINATFTGVKTDPNTGKPVATFTDKNGYPLEPLTWDQETIARLNNVAKSKGEASGITKLISEVSQAEKKQKNTVVDTPALDQKTSELESILYSKKGDEFEVNEDRGGYINKLNSFLTNNGIKADVEVNRNYGLQWAGGGPFVSINDQEFDLSKGADKEKIKSLVYDLAPAKFSKEKGAQQKSEPKQQSSQAPKKDEVIDGYKFLGGDPSDQNNWKKI
jgi:hypothetical protein